VADVQSVIAGSLSPETACEAPTPRFAELLADPAAALGRGAAVLLLASGDVT
jgi:hypothetical protein